ncbi:MAG: hypothetical protein AAF605_03125 [Myxococcota bacterium]
MYEDWDESAVFERLAQIQNYRTRFASLFDVLVAEQLDTLPLDGPWVEVGAGDGFFSAHLVARRPDGIMLTEPTKHGVDVLQRRFPGCAIVRCGTTELSKHIQDAAAIVGCCVLDVVDDLVVSLERLRDSLRPGGVLLHILDMATDLGALFQTLRENEVVALPNVFDDPLAESWPQDIMTIPYRELAEALESVGDHGSTDTLNVYLGAFAEGTAEAVAAFSAIQESRERRETLRAHLRDLSREATKRGRTHWQELRATSLSSAEVFHARLLDACARAGFQVDHAGIAEHRAPLNDHSVQTSTVGYLRSGKATRGAGYMSLGIHVLRASLA